MYAHVMEYFFLSCYGQEFPVILENLLKKHHETGSLITGCRLLINENPNLFLTQGESSATSKNIRKCQKLLDKQFYSIDVYSPICI